MITEKKNYLPLLLVAPIWGIAAVGPAAAEIPDHLYLTGDPSRILWVSAEASPNGRPPLLEIPQDATLEEQALMHAANDSDRSPGTPIAEKCTPTTRWQPALPMTFDIGTFDGLVRSSKLILEGTILDRKPGFVDKFPGYLLELRPDTVIKGNEASAKGETFFVFYSQGEIKAGPECYRIEDAVLPPLPATGDRLLVFALLHPADEEWRLIEPIQETVFIQRSGGTIEIPYTWQPMLEDLQVDSLGDLIRLTAAAADRMREEE
jgi:hypothetical protein